MPTRRRSAYHAVCYIVSSNKRNVAVSNQFVAKIVYQHWISICQQNAIDNVISVHALMSPNSWSTWSRKHIVRLLNNAWKWRLLCKTVIKNETTKETMSNTQMKITGDDYEYNAEYTYSSLPKPVLHALDNALSDANILQLLLRAPTALSAHVAVKAEGYVKWADGTRIDHIKQVWEFLNYEVKR